jgi:SPP1 family phage portal protein
MAIDFTSDQLNELLRANTSRHAEQTKAQRYYDGDHDITQGTPEERADGSTKSQLVYNFCQIGIEKYVGAMTSSPYQVSGEGDDPPPEVQAGIDAYGDIVEDQDLTTYDVEHLRTALVQGDSVEVHLFDADAPSPHEGERRGRIMVTRYDGKDWVFVYDEHDNLAAAIQQWTLEEGTVVDGEIIDDSVSMLTVYDDLYITDYKDDDGTWVVTREVPHAYGMVPVVRWSVNSDYERILSDAIIGQNDAYNETRSDGHDNVKYDADAMLLIKGYDSTQDVSEQKAARTLILQSDGDASFITKNSDHTKTGNDLDTTRKNMAAMFGIPDDEIVGATGGTSAIALKLAFMPMEQRAMSYFAYIKQGLRRRIELINKVHAALTRPQITDYVLTTTFTMPVNTLEEWEKITNLDGLVSDIGRLELLSSIDNPQRELDRLRAQELEKGQNAASFTQDSIANRTLQAEAAVPMVAGAVANATNRLAEIARSPQVVAAVQEGEAV